MNDDSLVSLSMGLEELLIAILKTSFPKGELKREMFAMHNSLFGVSKIISKVENVNTMCGSCIMRVRSNLFKYYHHEYEPKFDSLVFQDRYILDKQPAYGLKKK